MLLIQDEEHQIHVMILVHARACTVMFDLQSICTLLFISQILSEFDSNNKRNVLGGWRDSVCQLGFYRDVYRDAAANIDNATCRLYL